MTKYAYVIALAAMVVSAACGGGSGSPTTPPTSPPETLPTPPPVNGFTQTSVSPANDAALTWGEGMMLYGTYTLADETLSVGVALIRDDGEGFITDTNIGYRSQARPCPISDGFNLIQGQLLYHFMKGHASRLAFVIGRAGMMGTWPNDITAGGNLVRSQLAVEPFVAQPVYTIR